jgi:hypothetical protein
MLGIGGAIVKQKDIEPVVTPLAKATIVTGHLVWEGEQSRTTAMPHAILPDKCR